MRQLWKPTKKFLLIEWTCVAENNSGELLDGVHEWFTEYGDTVDIAMLTNQGGVSMRRWMEDHNFGDNPQKYPTLEDVQARFALTLQLLPNGPYPIFVNYAYQARRTGKWAPTPAGHDEDSPEWHHDGRMPGTLLLEHALALSGYEPQDSAFIGRWEWNSKAAAGMGIVYLRHTDWITPDLPF